MTTRAFSRLPSVRRVERSIRDGKLFAPGEQVLVAVSGGADSVFLLRALHALSHPLGLRLHVAHFDHGWRGDAAASDADFVRDLAAGLNLPFHLGSADTRSLARAHKASPEEAARQARYAYLVNVGVTHGIQAIATGHNEDDQVETHLLAWLRGSGPLGVGGIEVAREIAAPGTPTRTVRLVRPLLALDAAEIRDTLRDAGQEWREDATNQDPRLLRNRVRHELMPLLESLSPGYRKSTLRSMALAREAAGFLQRQASAAAHSTFTASENGFAAPRRALAALDPALIRPVLACVAGQLQGAAGEIEFAHLDQAARVALTGRGGAQAWLSPNLQLRVEGGTIVISLTPNGGSHPG
jgi:tRNA(Ile)-lysidine synthase